MPIDPVILLVEELRSVELALSKATQTYRRTSQREDGEVVNLLLAKLKRLFSELFETLPTSAAGAAELIDIAAQRLPFAYARFAAHLHNVADWLSLGRRDHDDRVRVRGVGLAALPGIEHPGPGSQLGRHIQHPLPAGQQPLRDGAADAIRTLALLRAW